jgi:hypothetical protein
VWNGYSALVTHFKEVAIDKQRTANEREKYTGHFQRVEYIEFVKDLGLMHDVLEEPTNLSLQLQERFFTITRADKLIKKKIRVAGTLKEKPGEKEREAAKASVSMNYHGIT